MFKELLLLLLTLSLLLSILSDVPTFSAIKSSEKITSCDITDSLCCYALNKKVKTFNPQSKMIAHNSVKFRPNKDIDKIGRLPI